MSTGPGSWRIPAPGNGAVERARLNKRAAPLAGLRDIEVRGRRTRASTHPLAVARAETKATDVAPMGHAFVQIDLAARIA